MGHIHQKVIFNDNSNTRQFNNQSVNESEYPLNTVINRERVLSNIRVYHTSSLWRHKRPRLCSEPKKLPSKYHVKQDERMNERNVIVMTHLKKKTNCEYRRTAEKIIPES